MKLKLFVFPSTTNCQGMVTTYSTLQDKKPIIAGKLISSSHVYQCSKCKGLGETQNRALYRLIEEVFEISTNNEWLREKLKMLKWKQAVFLLTETIVRSCANRSIMYLIERAILGDILPQFQDIEIDHVLHMFSSWVH